jgi:hypothetical protein
MPTIYLIPRNGMLVHASHHLASQNKLLMYVSSGCAVKSATPLPSTPFTEGKLTMFNRVTAALAIPLFIIGMSVNSTWARSSNQFFALKLFMHTTPHSTYRLAQACAGFHNECSNTNSNYPPCCQELVCVSNPNANGRMWCERRQ